MPSDHTTNLSSTALADERAREAHAVEAGLDALETRTTAKTPWGKRIVTTVGPPVLAAALFVLAWQIVFWANLKPDYVIPSPGMVWDEFVAQWRAGTVQEAFRVSVSRALIGFAISIVIAIPIGLVVARFRIVRAGIGPILTGLQTLPSVAWVPFAIILFGLEPIAIYTVIFLGAIPSIANGLVAGIDQTPPIYNRVGHVLGARRLAMVWNVALPAAFPGFLAGLKQGWAFAWRSLMAAELIVRSAALGLGFGQLLDTGRQLSAMTVVILAIILILFVGIAVELLLFAPVERRMLRNRGLAGARR
jgi:NitT/TauT family transport system permease protein